MTEGEKMVWAAAFVRHYMDEYESEGQYGVRYKRSVPTSIERAWYAVVEMREARPSVLEGFGEGEALDMLDEMLGLKQ